MKALTALSHVDIILKFLFSFVHSVAQYESNWMALLVDLIRNKLTGYLADISFDNLSSICFKSIKWFSQLLSLIGVLNSIKRIKSSKTSHIHFFITPVEKIWVYEKLFFYGIITNYLIRWFSELVTVAESKTK